MKNKFLNSSMELIKKNKKYTQDEIDMITYGLEGIYLTITKMIVIFGVALILNIFKEMIFLLISYNIIRSQAFGIHAKKSSHCLIFSMIMFIGGSIISKYAVLPLWLSIISSILCCICLFLYAPADTYKRPIVNKKKRMRFKILSFILGLIYTILIIIFNDCVISNYLLFGMILSVIIILPITYKMFNLPYNNYKNYGV